MDSSPNWGTLAYPSGRVVSTSFDSAGRPSGMAGKANASATQTTTYAGSVSYAAHGGLSGLTTGDNLARAFTYSPRLQTTQIQAGSLLTLGLSYDATRNNGNVAGATIARGSG